MEKKQIDDETTKAIPQRSPICKTVGKKLEKDIMREICEWLFSQGAFFWRSNNVPVFQRDRYGARFRSLPKFTPRGLPDICILHEGVFIALEVKVPGYWKFTDAQREIKEKVIKNGGAYHIVTSLGETMEVMAAHAPNWHVI